MTESDPAQGWIEVRGVSSVRLDDFSQPASGSPSFRESLTVSLAQSKVPMAGSYERVGSKLRFRPAFPLEEGHRYVARWRDGSSVETLEFELPIDPQKHGLRPGLRSGGEDEALRVALYPDVREVPANLLRIYLEFSRPMRRGEALERVQLRREDGSLVEGAFLAVVPELWDPSGQRLTLFLDPGRIKRGVQPNLTVGAALQPDRVYTLHIDGDWRSFDDKPLGEEHVFHWSVTVPDRTPPDPSRWQLHVPSKGVRDEFVVRFDEPIDRGLLERMLSIVGPHEKPLNGQYVIEEGERGLRFAPDEPWSPGNHSLVVPLDLEDRAGNSLRRPFETPPPSEAKTPTHKENGAKPKAPRRIPFVIR